MGSTVTLDVCGLPPPEPFVNIMAALKTLPADTILEVRIHREPFPLYDVLRENGFAWQTATAADGNFQILIHHAA